MDNEHIQAWLQAGPRLFAPLERVDEEARMVYGVFVTDNPVVDAWGYATILNWDATKAAVGEWQQWGNIREMHQLQAAGVAREITLREVEHQGYVGAYVADDAAWEKVRSGTYKGFSVGFNPKRWIETPDYDAPIEVVEYEIIEVSLVDRPRDPTARIDLWRAASQPEGGDPVVLQRVWEMVMGDMAIPETPEAVLALLRARLTPEPPPADATLTTLAELEGLATETRGDVDALTAQVATLTAAATELRTLATDLQARLTAVEQAPLPPQVQRGGGEAAEPLEERIRTLERTIKAERLSPQSREVQELMQLYQQRRAAN